MTKLKFTLSTVLPASPQQVYDAWLDSESHAGMTGGSIAIMSAEVDKPFAAHGAYLWGKYIELIPYKKIVQTWRTTGFKETDNDSTIEVTLEEHTNGTLLTLVHYNVPEQEYHVEQGWVSHYFEPMNTYFKNL